MVHYFTAREIAQLAVPGLPGTEQKLKLRAKNQDWPSRPRKGLGGGVEYELRLEGESFLSAEQQAHVREVLAEREERAGLTPEQEETLRYGRAIEAAKRAELEQASITQEVGLIEAKGLAPKARRRMDAKVEILALWGIYWKTHVPPIPRMVSEFRFVDAYNDGTTEVPEWVREMHPTLSASTLSRWRKVQEKEGIAALAGKWGTRKGTGMIESQPEIKEFIEGMIVNAPHVSVPQVLAGLHARFGKREGIKLPSLRRLGSYMTEFKQEKANALSNLTNPDHWRNNFMTGFGSASEAITRLNQRWELDSSPADLILADGRRHAILAAIDVYSRRLKLYVSVTSTSTAIAQVLRRAIRDWGVPEEVKTDNGSDYISKHITGVFAGLNITHKRCPVRQPWHKPHVEAVFRTFQHSILELLPGFVGHDVSERKVIEARKAIQRDMMKHDSTITMDFMSAEELQVFCDQWCENFYHQQIHSKLGKKPWEVAKDWPLPVRTISNERALDILVEKVPGGDGGRTVGKKGLKVEGHEFIAPELEAYVGQRMVLRYDPQDFGKVLVFTERDQRFVCVAECPELTGASRAEYAAKARALADTRLKEEKRILRAAAKKVKPADVVAEILFAKAEEAGKLTRFPVAAVEHETDGLTAAAEAAEVMSRAPEPEEEVDEVAHQATIHQFEEAKRRQSARHEDDDDLRAWEEALELERELHAQGDLTTKKMARLEYLRGREWYSGLIPTLEAFGILEGDGDVAAN